LVKADETNQKLLVIQIEEVDGNPDGGNITNLATKNH